MENMISLGKVVGIEGNSRGFFLCQRLYALAGFEEYGRAAHEQTGKGMLNQRVHNYVTTYG